MRYTDMSPNIRKRHGWYSLYSIITTRPIIYLYVWNERQKGSKSHAATTDTKLGLKKEYYTPRICKILGLANHIPGREDFGWDQILDLANHIPGSQGLVVSDSGSRQSKTCRYCVAVALNMSTGLC